MGLQKCYNKIDFDVSFMLCYPCTMKENTLQQKKNKKNKAHFLEFLREFEGLSRNTMCESLGMTRQNYYYHVTNGAGFVMTEDGLSKLSQVLGISNKNMQKAVHQYLFGSQ